MLIDFDSLVGGHLYPAPDRNHTVNDYDALWDMIRNDYSGRLVDVLDVKMA